MTPKHKHTTYLQHGITLVELVITLSIIGIMYTISIPNFNLFLMRQERELILDNLKIAIHYAQSEALKQRETILVCGSTDNKSCNPKNSWDRLIVIKKRDKTLLQTFAKFEYGKLRFDGFQDMIAFELNGMTNKTNGTFSYCPNNQSYKGKEARSLIINDAGRPYLNGNRNAKNQPLFCL